MHAQRIFVLSALLVAGIAQAQFAIRQVAKSGQAIPTIPSETFDDVRQNTCHPIVLDDGKVIFHTPYSGFGSILAEWDRFSFKDIMKPNDTPPPLPPDFTNAQGNPHSDPSIKAPAFSALVGMDYSWYISVRIGDFNVSGTKRGYFYQPLSGGIINTSPQYFGETDISSGGIATRSSDIFRTGYTPVDFDAFIAKESYSGLSRVLFQQNQQAYDLPLGVTYNNVLGANIDWTPLGRLHFLGTVTGTGITFSNNTVLCREEPLGLTVGIVAQSGTQHPAEPGLAAGGTFGYLSTYSLNAVGDLAFNVTITDPANTASTVGSIWYADEQDNLSLVVRQGGTYPVLGLGPAITFNFPGRAVITSNGDIVFPASWNDGGFRYGFFRWLKSTGNIQIEIQDGDPITGFGGLTGISFSNTGNEFCVSKTGRIAAECSVTIGGNTRLALVVQKPDASFQAAAIVGESISITGGDFLGTVATAELPGQAFSNGENRIPSPFSPTGRLVFFCTTSSDEALLAADVDFEPYNPLPVSAPAGRATLWDAPSRTISGLEIELQSVQTNLPGLASLTKPFDLEALTGLSSKQIRDLRGLEMFSDDAVEFAKTYMVARDNLLRVIEAIIPQDPQLAAWLLDSFRNGRISFGNAKSKKIKAFAQIFADADPACGTEPITLFFIPGEPLERYSDDFVQLMNTLMHEARHAFQSFPSIFTANTPIKKAEWALNRHQNELVASCEELERIDDLERAQAGLSSSNWARDTIAEMRADLTGQALADAEKELRARLRKMKRNAAETKECREDYIEAYERFLAGGIATSNAVTTLYTELGQNKWFRKFRNTTTAFGEIVVSGGGASYNSGSGQMDGNTSVRQLNTETGTETSFVPGTSPDYLQGGALSSDQATLYVGVKESGKSRVYGYTDFDNDALYDKSTESLIAEFPDATTGFELLQQDDRLLAVSDKEIRELLPSPGVLFSDPAGPPTADWDVDNQFIYGNDGLYGEPLTVGPQERIFTRSSNDTFAASSSYAQYESHQLVPVFSLAPVQGETEVLIQGQPGSSFHLYRGTSNPATNAPVAIGTIDSNGFASVTVPTLQFGESLAVSRPGEPAIPFKVWRTADLAAEFQNFFPSGGPGEHWVEMVGHPYLDLDLLTSGNPNGPWIFSSAVNDRPFGVTWQRVPLPPGNEEFFAVGDHGP